MTWNLGTIRTKIRVITGRLHTAIMSDSEIDDYINNYYTNIMPVQLDSRALEVFYSDVTVAGTGEYALASTVPAIKLPLMIDNVPIPLSYDKEAFFNDFPETETTQGEPIAALLFGRTLYLRPIPDAVYTYKAPITEAPTAFAVDGDVPADQLYGPLIANGAAVEIHLDYGESEEAQLRIAVMDSYVSLVFKKDALSSVERRTIPTF